MEPLQVQTGPMYLGKVTSRFGTVVLLPDRLAFVESNAPAWGAAFGALGMLITQRAAKTAAPGRAAEGGDGVTTVALREMQWVGRGSQGLNHNVLIVSGPAGDIKLGVKYDRWAPEIATAVRSVGRQSHESPDRVEFS